MFSFRGSVGIYDLSENSKKSDRFFTVADGFSSSEPAVTDCSNIG